MSFSDDATSLRSKLHISQVPRSALAGVAALLLALGVLACQHIASTLDANPFTIQKTSQAAAEQGADASSAQEDNASEQEEAQTLMAVHVGGCVVSPGVYRLVNGSLVQDAVDAAGGFSEDADRDALNLARTLNSGEQIIVPNIGDAVVADGAAAPNAAQNTSAQSALVNINTADAAALDALPGIGAATAQKIIADRAAQGLFTTKEDLQRVSGIGEKKYAALADLICV